MQRVKAGRCNKNIETWLSGVITPWPCQVNDLSEYSTVSGLAVALLINNADWRTVAAVVDGPPLNQTTPSAQGNPPQASLGLQDGNTYM